MRKITNLACRSWWCPWDGSLFPRWTNQSAPRLTQQPQQHCVNRMANLHSRACVFAKARVRIVRGSGCNVVSENTLGCALMLLGCVLMLLGCVLMLLGCVLMLLGCVLMLLDCVLMLLGCVWMLGCVLMLLGCVLPASATSSARE